MDVEVEILSALGVPKETIDLTRRATLVLEVNKPVTLTLETVVRDGVELESITDRYQLTRIEDTNG